MIMTENNGQKVLDIIKEYDITNSDAFQITNTIYNDIIKPLEDELQKIKYTLSWTNNPDRMGQ